jgi:hypothetical protein
LLVFPWAGVRTGEVEKGTLGFNIGSCSAHSE